MAQPSNPITRQHSKQDQVVGNASLNDSPRSSKVRDRLSLVDEYKAYVNDSQHMLKEPHSPVPQELFHKLNGNSIRGHKHLTALNLKSATSQKLKVAKPDGVNQLFKLVADSIRSTDEPKPEPNEPQLPKHSDLITKSPHRRPNTSVHEIKLIQPRVELQHPPETNSRSTINHPSRSHRDTKKKLTLKHVAQLFPTARNKTTIEEKGGRDLRELDDSFADRNAVEDLEKWTNEYRQSQRKFF